jgi:putative transposase
LRISHAAAHYFLEMPRNARCVLPDTPYHVTQRGTDRQRTFFSATDHKTYLTLLKQNLNDAGVRVLAYCPCQST